MSFTEMNITIQLWSQYHTGSGFGLGRIIDSLLDVTPEGIPFLKGTAVLGICAQGMYDLLRFEYFQSERTKMCEFQKDLDSGVKPSCGIKKPSEDSCLLCYFFGSNAQDGVIQCQDFKCVTDEQLLVPMFHSGNYNRDERRQVIREYASHRQNMRTRTVEEKHFFVAEEGRGDLLFQGKFQFRESLKPDKMMYLAAALKNVRAVGRRKSRGKGICRIETPDLKLNEWIEKINVSG